MRFGAAPLTVVGLTRALFRPVQVMPQGCICLALAAQAERGEFTVTLPGLHAGTFIDPRCGRGTPLAPPATVQYVSVDEETGDFTYRLPPVTVAMFSAPAADRHGNIYNRGASVQSEMVEIAGAAYRNRGLVIALVGKIVEPGCVFARRSAGGTGSPLAHITCGGGVHAGMGGAGTATSRSRRSRWTSLSCTETWSRRSALPTTSTSSSSRPKAPQAATTASRELGS